jgi:hypothetical protein
MRRGGGKKASGPLGLALHASFLAARERLARLQQEEAASRKLDTLPTTDLGILPSAVKDAMRGALIVRVGCRSPDSSIIFCTAVAEESASAGAGCQAISVGDRIAVRAAFEGQPLPEDGVIAVIPVPWTPLHAPAELAMVAEDDDVEKGVGVDAVEHFLGLSMPVVAIVLASAIGPFPRHLYALIPHSLHTGIGDDEGYLIRSPSTTSPLHSVSLRKRRRLSRRKREILSVLAAPVFGDNTCDDGSRVAVCADRFSLIEPHVDVISVTAKVVAWSPTRDFAIIRDAVGVFAIWWASKSQQNIDASSEMISLGKCRVAVHGLPLPALYSLLTQLSLSSPGEAVDSDLSFPTRARNTIMFTHAHVLHSVL